MTEEIAVWTLESLKTYFEALLLSDKDANDARFVAAEKAVLAAYTTANLAVDAALTSVKEAGAKSEGDFSARISALNELRGMVQDVVNTMMPRLEAENRMTANAERIAILSVQLTEGLSELRTQIATDAATDKGKLDSIASLKSTIMWAAGLVTAGITIIVFYRGR